MKASARAAVLAVSYPGSMRTRRISASVRPRSDSIAWLSMADRATRSPKFHNCSTTAFTRASSAAVRKNGRRNGQRTRSPKRRRRARISAASDAHSRPPSAPSSNEFQWEIAFKAATRPGRCARGRPSSAHRGHEFCAVPRSARSITRSAIFCTAISK